MDIDISKLKYDNSTFIGRYKHFSQLTNPLNVLKSDSQLLQAKEVVRVYQSKGILPTGGVDGLWQAKYVYDSAFHPETGEKQNLIGRMSFQVPGGMLITGILLAFYKSPLEIFLGQFLNQSFNALVNFTNRSGDKPLPKSTILTAYVSATSAATVTAIGLRSLVKRAPPLIARFVPFSAVAAANMVNIPLMRQTELKEGIAITDEDGNKLGNSVTAARHAITQVTISRIIMAAPGMLGTPVIMNWLERKPFMKNVGKVGNCCIQTLLVGAFLLNMVPIACAMFPQRQNIRLDDLESDLVASIREKYPNVDYVYYNKGL